MSTPKPARYRTTNGSAYNAVLRKRGSLLIWLDKVMGWHVPHDGRPGHRSVFSNAAVQFCPSTKMLFKLPPPTSARSSVTAAGKATAPSCRRARSEPQDEDIGTVSANGAYDTRRCQSAIILHVGALLDPGVSLPGNKSHNVTRIRLELCEGPGRESSQFRQAPPKAVHPLRKSR